MNQVTGARFLNFHFCMLRKTERFLFRSLDFASLIFVAPFFGGTLISRKCFNRGSLVSDISRPPIRQVGRKMSGPRPYETNPFHPSALFTPCTTIEFYVYTHNGYSCFFHVVFTLCLGILYICHLRMRSSRTTSFKV